MFNFDQIQMIRRKVYEKMPLQGNVYPMPTMSYIEDDYLRFTVLASQSSGITCLKSGIKREEKEKRSMSFGFFVTMRKEKEIG